MLKSFIFSFLVLTGLTASAQTTVTLYSTSAAGTFKTGHTTTTAATSGAIWSGTTPTSYNGWAVFYLDSTVIPHNAQITSVIIGFNTATYGGSGTPSGWNTYGYTGNLADFSGTPSTLYSDCTAGTSLTTATYGTTTGNHTLATTAASDTFVAHNIGDTVSICFTGGGSRLYKITGLGGTAATTGTHAPYLQITYCTTPTSVTATAPSSVCSGSSFSLTGSASGATSYSWAGPGGFTSTAASPTITATAASAGIYTLTATNACGTTSLTATATTASVAVSTPPVAITGTFSVCATATTTLSESVTGGTWSATPVTVATVSPTGVVTGTGSGTATIQYTVPGCTPASAFVSVNTTPTSLVASATPAALCPGGSLILSGSASGAASYSWSGPGGYSASTASASFSVTTANSGIYTLTATNVCGNSTALSAPVTVHPTPAAIIGPSMVCLGSPTSFTDGTSGGVWSCSDTAHATVSSAGVVTGLVVSTVTIFYTNPTTGCFVSSPVDIGTSAGPITGITNICPGGVLVVADTSVGGTWHSSDTAVASVSSTGVVAAYSPGSVLLSFSSACGASTASLTVSAPPAAIDGPSVVCAGRTISLSDPTPGGAWHSASFSVATVDAGTGVVTGVTGGSVLITYTTGPACYASIPVNVVASVPASVTAIALPGFVSCGSDTVHFLASPTNGGTAPAYTWTINGSVVSSANTYSYVPVNGDVVGVSMISNATCALPDTSSFTSSMTVSPNIYPSITISVVPNDTIAYQGETVMFTAEITYGGATPGYQWYINGSPVPGATGPSFATTIDSNETVYCSMTSSLPCASPVSQNSNQIKVVDNFLAVPDVTLAGTSISVYPDPNQGSFTLQSANGINGSMTITDVAGKVVYSDRINESSAFSRQVSVPGIAPGLYLLRIASGGNSVTIKLAVSK